MDKIEVTQADRSDIDIVESLNKLRREMELRWTGQFVDNAASTIDAAVAEISRHRATRTDATPVAWMPIDSAPQDEQILAAIKIIHKNGQTWWERHIIVIDSETGTISDMDFHHGWEAEDYEFWQPLPAAPDATHPPATDVAAQDDTALLEKLADEACKRLGIDPNEIVDPVGPVRKKDDIIYAMYAFAREKFWDTEPNDVAALVEAAKAILHAVCHETGFAAAVRADSGLAYPWEPLDIAESQLRQALVPFTEGQP